MWAFVVADGVCECVWVKTDCSVSTSFNSDLQLVWGFWDLLTVRKIHNVVLKKSKQNVSPLTITCYDVTDKVWSGVQLEITLNHRDVIQCTSIPYISVGVKLTDDFQLLSHETQSAYCILYVCSWGQVVASRVIWSRLMIVWPVLTCSSRYMSWSLASLLSREKSGNSGESLRALWAILDHNTDTHSSTAHRENTHITLLLHRHAV